MNRELPRATLVAALYDIHGNLPALEAVLAQIATIGPDLIVIGGDVAAGPLPGATIARLMGLAGRARFVRGNADRAMVAAYDRPRDAAPPDDVDATDGWAARQLTRAQRDFLAAFPASFAVTIAGLGPVRFCHGSPRSDEEILTRATGATRLAASVRGVPERVIVCGHTHVQYDRVVAGRRVVNAGSVGMPYEGRPGAYWALLGPDVSLQRTGYDFELAAARIAATGYPRAAEFARENVLAPPSADAATEHFERLAGDDQRDSRTDPGS